MSVHELALALLYAALFAAGVRLFRVACAAELIEFESDHEMNVRRRQSTREGI